MIETTNKFWVEIYRQNIKKMIGICYRYTYDSQLAEDLAHDAFVLAYQKVASFEGKGPFEAWLRRIVINVCLQYIRDKSKERYVHDFLSNEATDMDTDAGTENKNYDFSHEELLAAINQLPEHHKLVFNLYVIDRFSHMQIGKELGISEGTSKSHLARARKKIKQILFDKLNSMKGKKRSVFFLFVLPLKIRNIEKLYHSRFTNFEIQNVQPLSFESFGTNTVQIPVFKSPVLLKYLYPAIATIGVAIIFVVYLNIKENGTGSESKISTGNKTDTIIDQENKNLAENQNSTATHSRNGIIVKRNNFLTNKNDTMKNSKTFATVLAAAITLASANAQIVISDTGLSNSKKLLLDNQIISSGQSNVENFKPIAGTASGTFYAASISWSADDHVLYFNGKVIVDIDRNKFIGNGKFSVIGKVYYLVVDGQPVKLGAKINLDETKKNKLTQIAPQQAIAKYGDAGRQGAVEIELAASTN